MLQLDTQLSLIKNNIISAIENGYFNKQRAWSVLYTPYIIHICILFIYIHIYIYIHTYDTTFAAN